ncbi:MAG TPA: hypothetical protein VF476_09840 [Chitinophagaceae bacterium]
MRLRFLRSIVAFSAIFLFSCDNSSKTDKAIIAAMEESLANSNKSLNNSTATILVSLEDKMADPITHEKAKIWFPKAEQIKYLSVSFYDYIEKLKNNKIDKEKAIDLFKKIQKYKADILSTDSLINLTFAPILEMEKLTSPADIHETSFYRSFLKNASSSSISAFLIKLQNYIKVIENKISTFCHEQVPNGFCGMDGYTSAIVGQSSKVVEPGDLIEIIAGIGSFERRSNPEIIVNEKPVALNDYGNAIYQFKASNKPGKYSTPVKIIYTDQEGKTQIIETTVKYSVVKICEQ